MKEISRVTEDTAWLPCSVAPVRRSCFFPPGLAPPLLPAAWSRLGCSERKNSLCEKSNSEQEPLSQYVPSGVRDV